MKTVTKITADEAKKMYYESQKLIEDTMKRARKFIKGGRNE